MPTRSAGRSSGSVSSRTRRGASPARPAGGGGGRRRAPRAGRGQGRRHDRGHAVGRGRGRGRSGARLHRGTERRDTRAARPGVTPRRRGERPLLPGEGRARGALPPSRVLRPPAPRRAGRGRKGRAPGRRPARAARRAPGLERTAGMHVVLVAPEIPQNTGSIGRLCLATATTPHLIDPLGFTIDDRHLRRAGLDYWPHVRLPRHPAREAFLAARPPGRLLCFSARAARSYTTVRFRADDLLVFGSESRGLPAAIRSAHAEATFGIPLASEHVRSLNLATAVAIVLYEALRQQGKV